MIIDPPGKNRANATPFRPRLIGQGRGRARPRRGAPFRRGARRFGRVFILLPALVALAIWFEGRGGGFPPGENVAGLAYVVDGDTLRIGDADLRIVGLDAPEMRQFCRRGGIDYRCGVEARWEMERLVASAQTRCVVDGSDRYGRSLARCEANGRDLGAAMVLSGHAVAFGAYEAEEAKARAAGRGLWAGEFERPGDWRARQGPSEAGYD